MATSWKRIVWEGLILGAIGYGTSALLFGLANLLTGRSFAYTPAVLGSMLFYGVHDPQSVTVWAGPVIAFNGVHIVVMLLFGLVLSWLVSKADQDGVLLYLATFAVLFGALHMTVPALLLSSSVHGAVSFWMLVVVGACAAAAMVVYAFHAHPHLHEELTEDLEMLGI